MDENNFKILVIDENQDRIITIKDFISTSFPFSDISVASTGEEGLRLAVEIPPDIVLLDTMLTDMVASKYVRFLNKMFYFVIFQWCYLFPMKIKKMVANVVLKLVQMPF